MRLDYVRTGGTAAIVLGLLMVLRLLGEAVTGTNVYGDDAAAFLEDLEARQWGAYLAMFAIFASPLALVPFLIGLIHGLQPADRPSAIGAGAFVAFGALLLVGGFAAYGTLPNVAASFVDAPAALKDPLAEDGEQIASFFGWVQLAAYVVTGAGLILTGRLMRRSLIFPGWLAWITIVVGVAMAAFIVLGGYLLFAHPAWLLLLGWWMMTRREQETEAGATFARPA